MLIAFSRSKHQKPAKNFGSPLRLIFNVLVIFIFSQAIAVLIAGATLSAIHGKSLSIDDSAAAQLQFIVIAEGLAAGSVFYILKLRKLALSTIGLGRRPVLSDVWRAMGGFVVFYILLIIALTIVGSIDPSLNSEKQDVGFNNLHTAADSVLAFIALVILPPLGEETLIRGYLYSGLRFFWRFLPSLIVTSLIFGAAHLQFGSGAALLWAAAIDTFLLSVVLVYLREKTGVLYAGILVHMLNNMIAFGFHFHALIF
jgi:membrane protease YdiL (CAAX protease family)